MKYTISITRKIIIILFVVSGITNSQQWVKTFDGDAHGDDQVLASATDIQGNVYVTGFSTRTGTGKDYCTIKYSSSGSALWTAYYNGPANDEDKAFGIAVDRLGENVFVTGYSTSIGGNIDFTTVKYSASTGSQLNVVRFGDPSNEEDKAFGVVVDRFNNVYVTGYVTRTGTGTDIYTVKYNQNLVYIWQKIFNGSGNADDRAFGIITDSLGLNIYVTGFATNIPSGRDMITIGYDSSGTQKWAKSYNGNGSGEDKSFGIAVDRFEGGGVYVTGFSTDSLSKANITTIKYNPVNGNQIWAAKYTGGNTVDKSFGVVVDRSGNSYVTGTSTASNQFSDYITIKFGFQGDTIWTAKFSGPGNGNDSACDLALSNTMNYLYVTGTSNNGVFGQGNSDIYTIKYDVVNGRMLQSSRIILGGNKSEYASKIEVDTSNDVFVSGYAETPSSGYDFLTMKYDRGELVIGIQVISTEVPAGFALYQNYPNPFNPKTLIRFEVPPKLNGGEQFVQLKVYDILGREVAALVNNYMKPATYEVDWDASKFASGIYFYSLSTGEFKNTKRMILVK